MRKTLLEKPERRPSVVRPVELLDRVKLPQRQLSLQIVRRVEWVGRAPIAMPTRYTFFRSWHSHQVRRKWFGLTRHRGGKVHTHGGTYHMTSHARSVWAVHFTRWRRKAAEKPLPNVGKRKR